VRREDRGLPEILAVLSGLRGEAVKLGNGLDVTLDEVDAIVVVDGHVHHRHAPVNALRFQSALASGDPVAAQLDGAAGGRHDRGASSDVCVQRAVLP
jgi:hypothetical protein